MSGPDASTPLVPPEERILPYANLPTADGPKRMHVRLFRPAVEAPPLLIWLHSGGFRAGRIAHPVHGEMAHEFARHGVATAFVQYRLRTKVQHLSSNSARILPDLLADAEAADFGLKPHLRDAASIAAVENLVVFLQWLDKTHSKHGLTGPRWLGGSSAGAMTVLNLLSLAPHIGIGLPKFQAAFAMSGGFAFPSFYTPNPTPIYAVHKPSDFRVPIASIRAFAAQASGTCFLEERGRQPHGGLTHTLKEPLWRGVDRLVAFAQDGWRPPA